MNEEILKIIQDYIELSNHTEFSFNSFLWREQKLPVLFYNITYEYIPQIDKELNRLYRLRGKESLLVPRKQLPPHVVYKISVLTNMKLKLNTLLSLIKKETNGGV